MYVLERDKKRNKIPQIQAEFSNILKKTPYTTKSSENPEF